MVRFFLIFFGVLAVIGGIAVLILRATYIDFWVVPTDDPELTASIAPNLKPGELVVVSKDAIPEIPNLVRCTNPKAGTSTSESPADGEKPESYVIGRMVAASFEAISINADSVTCGKRRAPSPRRCDPPVVDVKTKDGETRLLDCFEEEYTDRNFNVLRSTASPSLPFSTTVESGKVFLVSDNRTLHVDSRDFDAVEPRTCRRIWFRVWGAEGFTDPLLKWVW